MRRTVSISGDGLDILFGLEGGKLYSSSDGGENWVEEQPAGAGDQLWVASSVNREVGSLFIVGIDGGRLYLTGEPYFPDITTETHLEVSVGLYTKVRKVDPTALPVICGPLGCAPEADLRFAAFPVADLEMDPIPEVDLHVASQPSAALICRLQ